MASSSQPPVRALLHPIRVGSGVRQPARKNEQAQSGKSHGGGEIKYALQHPNAKHARHRLLALTRQKQRTNRLPGPAEHEDRREAHDRRGENIGEPCGPEISRKTLPANGAKSVTAIDSDQRQQQKPRVRLHSRHRLNFFQVKSAR